MNERHILACMRHAISYVNSDKFRVKTETERQVWNECSRLIANAIIYYNTLLLSRVYEQKLAANDQEAIKILRGTSAVRGIYAPRVRHALSRSRMCAWSNMTRRSLTRI